MVLLLFSKRSVYAIGILAALLSALFLTSKIQAQEESQVFTVMAGYEDPSANGLEVEAFLPSDLSIKVGDTVRWDFAQFEPHTVSFLSGGERPADIIPTDDGRVVINPVAAFPAGGPEYDGTGYVNSGLPPMMPDAGPFSYELTFTTPGSFEYFCLIHPQQVGVVNVLSEDTPPVFPPDIVTANAEIERDELIEEVQAIQDALPENRVTRQGALATHTVYAGISSPLADLMTFDQPNLEIARGDTVTWTWGATGAPHNVLFAPAGETAPEFIVPQFNDDGPPDLVVNQAVLAPAGGEVFNPNELMNSGLRFNPEIPAPPGFAPGANYSVTFNQEGTYTYLCSLHYLQGMAGVITVGRARPTPPLVGDYAPSGWLMAGIGFGGLALLIGGGALARRKAALQPVRIDDEERRDR